MTIQDAWKECQEMNAILRASLAAAEERLGAIYEECDNYADCDDGPEEIANRPNLAMRVQMMIKGDRRTIAAGGTK